MVEMAEEFTSCIASDLHHAQFLAIITLVVVGSIYLDNTYFALSEYDRGEASALIHIIFLPSHICMLLLGIFFAYITVRGENSYIKGTESMLAIGIILSFLCTIAVAFTSFMVEPVEWEERTGYRKQQETAKTIGENTERKILKDCNKKLWTFASGDTSAEKQYVLNQIKIHQEIVDTYSANAKKLQKTADMLNAKISAINSRQNELKAKLLMAETQEKVNALTNVDYGRGLDDVMTALEEQANARLNNAQAIKELGENAESSIVEKYAGNAPAKVIYTDSAYMEYIDG